MKASDLLVQCLENEGIEYIFGVPGEEEAPGRAFIARNRAANPEILT
ncbi:MAG: hypothetical protein Q8L45_00255 [Xanthomonadaceae bacterium]|nr:hypothetical protein [Xanthomonadaceae bacterium]MDP2184351.1 hypothetical protein [Xanthomonadales bacterium]MDZ4114683.1 hypothetical protein [Xanthomonadaceae bacterium]MDZ4377953.1 hypothetical protein [Xanthomonadaceae bacterium]